MFKSIPFEFEGEQYEVRLTSDGSTMYVRAFKDGQPADGFGYQVSFPVAMDIQAVMGLSAVEELIAEAQRNVRAKTWQEVLKLTAEMDAKSGKMRL